MSRTRLASLFISTALAAGVTVAAAPAAQAGTLFCKRVIANDVRVFTSAGGQNIYGVYNFNTVYYVDRTDAPYNRYHVPNFPSSSGNAWTTSDPAYVTNC